VAELHRALLGVSTQVDPYLTAHKKASKFLYRTSDVHGISSIFHYKNLESEGLVVAYSLRTLLSADQLQDKITALENQSKIATAEIRILVYDDFIVRKPNLVIPWVELHERKKWSVPAAYLWPDYVHPIENKDLRSLSESLHTDEVVEFYGQSKSLLDFLSLEP
jgi:7,8-dihydro-6-hydroxymethylpterin-pyrophosphokinase